MISTRLEGGKKKGNGGGGGDVGELRRNTRFLKGN